MIIQIRFRYSWKYYQRNTFGKLEHMRKMIRSDLQSIQIKKSGDLTKKFRNVWFTLCPPQVFQTTKCSRCVVVKPTEGTFSQCSRWVDIIHVLNSTVDGKTYRVEMECSSHDHKRLNLSELR